jgi:hypothetical protein
MSTGAKARHAAAAKAAQAAGALTAWLNRKPRTAEPAQAAKAPARQAAATLQARPTGTPVTNAQVVEATAEDWPADRRNAGNATPASSRISATGGEPDARHAPQRLAHTDWLYHRLRVTGSDAVLAGFRAAAAGAGTIPWRLDLNRMEEDLFHLLMAPPVPAGAADSPPRRISLHGARILAGQLRDAAGRRQDLAAARVGPRSPTRPAFGSSTGQSGRSPQRR